MTGGIIAAAQDQILLLLNEQKELLEALRTEEDLLHSHAEDGKERVLDEKRAVDFVEILDAEKAKAERLEITLAVAGTVKAGKSTVVNAIIGTEALPNRARPMTALPTVIRHEPDRFDPALTVNNAAALNKLASRIARKLQSGEQLEAVRSSHGVDMGALIDGLADGARTLFDGEYEGRARVFDALAQLNDLLRLGRHEAIGEELAIEEYDDLHEMPALAMHFRCLADTARGTGSLALLDLPGFNEAQLSDHLTKVLEEQLEKASAILVVLDYTQLNTEASEELEILLDAVSGMMRDRIFVVVNKFDQRTPRDPNAGETKANISANMMRGKVDPEHVYPVSAQQAYLASRALDALDRTGGLSSPEDELWVSDFTSLVFPLDQSKLEEPHEVRRAAEYLWDNSGFEPLLNAVIVASQRRAAILALESTLEKLKAYGNRIENHLNIANGALTADVQDLLSMIQHVDRDIEAIRAAHAEFNSRKEEMDSLIKTRIDNETRDLEQKMGSQFQKMYYEEIDKSIQAEKQKIIRKKQKDVIGSMLGRYNRKLKALEQLKGSKKIEYYDRREYREARAQIKQIYTEISRPALENFLELITNVIQDEREELSTHLAAVLENISRRTEMKMSEAGIELTITVPGINIDSGAAEAGRIRFSHHKKSRNVTRSRVTNRTLAWFNDSWFGRAFDLEWGTEEYKTSEDYWEISLDKTHAELRTAIQESIDKLRTSIQKDIDKWKEDCEDKLEYFRNDLHEINQGLIDGQKERSESKVRLEKVIAAARKMKQKSEKSRAGIRDFEAALAQVLGTGSA